MILIGSKAIKHWFPDFPREPKDTDYAVVKEDLKSNHKGIEYLTNPILVWGLDPIIVSDNNLYNGIRICPPNELYTLKMSHLFWDLAWQKHLWDLHFLKKKGCVLNRPLFDKLYIYFNELHGKNKRSDLKMTANEFFTNALDCPYDHDKLHTILNPIPTFNKVLKDGEEVEISEEKFLSLSDEEKEALVREEVEIMAFERFPKIDHRKAYGRMLKKFIISHAPMEEAIWILENYPKLCMPKDNFIKKINEKINENREYFIKRSTRLAKKQE